MVYHILTYIAEDVYGGNDFFLHIISKNFDKDWCISLAQSLVSKYSKETDLFSYIGCEQLPVNIDECWIFFKGGRRVELLEKHGETKLNALATFKSNRITIDYDVYDIYYAVKWVSDVLDIIPDIPFENYVFLKTHRGAHLRGILTKSLSFDEKIELRKRLWDDEKRIIFDEYLFSLGFEGLTDLLFNFKCWKNGEYTEQPMFIDEVSIEFELPKLEFENYTIFERKIQFKKSVYIVDAVKTKKLVEKEYREFAERYRKEVHAKDNILKAYIDIGLGHVISKCEIKVEDGKVTVKVPKCLSEYTGRLIGRNGANVKFAEERVGLPITIIPEYIPESFLLKNRLKNLYEKLVGGE